MIFQSKITVSELSKDGKNHKWDKCHCNKCNRWMWGHGFVGRYFTSLEVVLFLKRYRCPDCSTVVTARPYDYWPFVRSSISIIHSMLMARVLTGFWPSGFPRQRGGHWLRRFAMNAKMACQEDLPRFLGFCLAKGLHFFH